MKKLILVLCPLLFLVASCTQKAPDKLILKGEVKGFDISKLYVCRVLTDYNLPYQAIDSIDVINGTFEYHNDTIPTELYGLAFKGEYSPYDNVIYCFLGKGNMTIKIDKDQFGNPKATEVTGLPIQDEYMSFIHSKDSIMNKPLLDSLDNIFFEAKKRQDTITMMRIKEESAPYYDKAMTDANKWALETALNDRKDLFGLFLAYSYKFPTKSFNSMEAINNAKKYIDSFDKEAKESSYYKKLVEALEASAVSAVGQVAPDIKGTTPDEKEVKLSDFKGKYVLIDFWSSYCTWCRAESPNILRTYKEFKDKNFVVLSVSSDHEKDAWLEAIKHDGMIWDNILLSAEEKSNIFKQYNIQGIPEIILLDPEGKILAKSLRGEDLYNAVRDAVNK
ncbi:TlpA disulfide reductase family protein [Porphyromonas pogonae]|uniref:TlpA disulfide reductase family protein n=1 Tax=Porphyromonas pogonae TaxID=867595 RepID=UPI002E78AF0B|nr:TlpA disulfide reductase family protein [Porphyromonas pogonae]